MTTPPQDNLRGHASGKNRAGVESARSSFGDSMAARWLREGIVMVRLGGAARRILRLMAHHDGYVTVFPRGAVLPTLFPSFDILGILLYDDADEHLGHVEAVSVRMARRLIAAGTIRPVTHRGATVAGGTVYEITPRGRGIAVGIVLHDGPGEPD